MWQTRAERIEGDEDLQEKPILQIQIEPWVSITDAHNHVIFECAYCPLTRVVSVASRGCQLEVNVLVLYEFNQGLTCLVVEALDLGMEAAGNEDDVGLLVGQLDLVASAGGHGIDMYVVTVIVIYD